MLEKMGMEAIGASVTKEREVTGVETLRARIEALNGESGKYLQAQVHIQKESDTTSSIWQDTPVYGPTVDKDGPSRNPQFCTDEKGNTQMVCSFVNAQGKTEKFVSVDVSGSRFKNEETGEEVEVRFVL